METSRLWARVVAQVEPALAESLAEHLVKRTYSEPHWEKKQGAVMAFERVTLYGVPIVANRKVNYGRIDPVLSRELFIRHALVEGDWETHHTFFAANTALLARIEEIENRARRRDILVDDETVYALYDARIPADIVSARHFDAWWKKARHTDPDLLTFTRELLVNEGRDTVDPNAFPDAWLANGVRLPLTYEFEPNSAEDGVTVEVPAGRAGVGLDTGHLAGDGVAELGELTDGRLDVVGVATGGANVQFAYEPTTRELALIEMNPRVSRSSQ